MDDTTASPTAPTRTPSAAAPAAPVAAVGVQLDRLDDALVAVRRVLQRPGYRRRLRASLGDSVELSALRVLRAVERADDVAPCIGDVAGTLLIDPSTASRCVDRCVDAGLLERRPSESDRRRSQLALTASGEHVLARATAARRSLLAEVTESWPDEDVEHLLTMLQALQSGFDRLEDEG